MPRFTFILMALPRNTQRAVYKSTAHAIYIFLLLGEQREPVDSHLEQLTNIFAQLTQAVLTYGPRFNFVHYNSKNTKPTTLGYTLFTKQSGALNIELIVRLAYLYLTEFDDDCEIVVFHMQS